MKINKFTLTALSCCMTALSMFGWGQKGHDTTAYIAEQHLTPTTKHVVDSLFDGMSLVYWSNWLDNASHTPKYSYSKTWHYKNIDANENYDEVPTFTTGDILSALEEQLAALKSGKLTKQEAALALKIVTHLMGDLHQPMHMGHKSDLGGNRIKIKYFDSDRNLHGIWDTSLVESAHKWSFTEWQQQIDRADAETEAALLQGTIKDWGRETYEIATEIYNTTPEGTKISYDYIANWTPTIEQQFLKGGLRLAHVLNSTFDPNYNK